MQTPPLSLLGFVAALALSSPGRAEPSIELFGGIPWEATPLEVVGTLADRDDVHRIGFAPSIAGSSRRHEPAWFVPARSLRDPAELTRSLERVFLGPMDGSPAAKRQQPKSYAGYDKSFNANGVLLIAEGISFHGEPFVLEIEFERANGLVLDEPERIVETPNGSIGALITSLELGSGPHRPERGPGAPPQHPIERESCVPLLDALAAKYAQLHDVTREIQRRPDDSVKLEALAITDGNFHIAGRWGEVAAAGRAPCTIAYKWLSASGIARDLQTRLEIQTHEREVARKQRLEQAGPPAPGRPGDPQGPAGDL